MPFYLLNSPILTDYGQWRFDGPLSVDDIKRAIAADFISAIGHDATAQILSRILKLNIPCNRIQIQMKPNDRALIFRLQSRLPEGHILNQWELQALPYEIGLLTRLA